MTASLPLKIILAIALVTYPFLVLLGLTHWGITPIAMMLMAAACLKLLIDRHSQLAPLYWLGVVCGILSLWRQETVWLKFYPVAMNIGALSIFAWTLTSSQSMIERLARIKEPNLPASGVAWTRKVTQVWCVFFLCNALIAAYTAVFGSLSMWTWYNGFVSYILMGGLLLGEYVLRRRHLAHQAKP